MRSRLVRILVACTLALVLAGGIVYWQESRKSGSGQTVVEIQQRGTTQIAGDVEIGGSYTLTGHHGEPVSSDEFQGEYQLIYFGYTYCPDFCPTSLQVIADATTDLNEAGVPVQPVFVTIDPERDTVEAMADYVDLFHPDMLGLTGSDEEIASVASDFRVHYSRVDADSATEYLVDHTTFTYIMGPDGSLVDLFGHDVTAEQLSSAVRAHQSS